MIDSGTLGAQGGDGRGRPDGAIDLGTCVNRYGPAPAAKHASTALDDGCLMHHPYGAADECAAGYATYLGVMPQELVVQRGISGAIWSLASSSLASSVTVPVPAYTEYLQAFRAAQHSARTVCYDVEVLDGLLAAGRTVLISNPHNQSGTHLEPDLVEALALRHPQGRVIVDESYSEFVANQPATLIGCGARNVAVLRSPSKFFGVAGIRVGVVWSRDEELLHAVEPRLGSWPVSRVEVAIAAAALADKDWAASVREQVGDDVAWLADVVADRGLAAPPTANFVLVGRRNAFLEAQELERRGVYVRALGVPHGLPHPALRIAAPRIDERAQVLEALSAELSNENL
jgi:histidinol-phosphate/aromatic aminotransferase/cobyric acid decarboxylase-like protein